MAQRQSLTVAVVAGDPGGANALRPVISQLLQLGIVCKLYAYAQAAILWEQWPLSNAEIPALLGVDVLLTATSVNEQMFELAWITAAQKLAIPSLAVIDYWSNYAERFIPAPKLTNSTAVWPDWIAVLDEQARADTESLCSPTRGIVVVGHTLLDAVANTPDFTTAERSLIRSECGIDTEFLLTYISQPLRNMAQQTGKNITFDEQQVLLQIEQVLLMLDLPIALRVRLHPRENSAAYPALASIWPNTALALNQGPYDLLRASDAVVGINSMLLLEACYLGGQVLSYQPGNAPDSLPSNRFGWSKLCRCQDELAQAIVESYAGRLCMKRPTLQMGASMKIIEQLFRMNQTAKH